MVSTALLSILIKLFLLAQFAPGKVSAQIYVPAHTTDLRIGLICSGEIISQSYEEVPLKVTTRVFSGIPVGECYVVAVAVVNEREIMSKSPSFLILE